MKLVLIIILGVLLAGTLSGGNPIIVLGIFGAGIVAGIIAGIYTGVLMERGRW